MADANQFHTGVRVRALWDAALIGECTGKVVEDGDILNVQVRFPGQPADYYFAEDLELASVAMDAEDLVQAGRFARSSHLRKRLTTAQLSGQLSEMIYSLDTTDTEFMPHQFKPLLALLDSPSKGVLIADEVGLGKTIEAGLIWTELRFRTNATRLLVICPAMLTEKWTQELRRRFGTAAQVMSAKDLLTHMEQGESAPKIPAIICSLQGIRPPTDDGDTPSSAPAARLARLLEEAQDQTLFDLVVIDEAHYMRNRETSSAKLGQLLRPIADYFVLLSATPVNNRSTDLFNLVSLVDPDQFRFESEFAGVLNANQPLVRLANQIKRPDATIGVVREALDKAQEHWIFEDSAGLQLIRNGLEDRSNHEILTPEERVSLGHRLERVNLLGQIIVRSRKREVIENRVVRNVQRCPVRMTKAESDFYGRVTEAVLSYALSHDGVQGFLLATPQRQMSSCMYAAAKRWSKYHGEPQGDEDEFAFEAFGTESVKNGSSVTSYVASAISGHVDIEGLRQNDSKFKDLSSLLSSFFKEAQEEKAIVFSYFRDTLDYLKERLDALGIPAIVVKGGDNKQEIIEEFKESPTYRVLLASEVAAEGVDLQFMRLLINYDLPWNPMRIEQRIGRIDRIGQKAESIAIANFVYEDTVDDRILTRLFHKLRLFEDALGCTEEVLGDSMGLLTKELLSAHLSPAQQEVRIDQVRVAMEQRRQDMARIEEHEADFLGLGEYVRDRVAHARNTQRKITDQDLTRHIQEYLEEVAAGYLMRIDVDTGAGVIRLPAGTAAALTRFREARQLPRSRLESGQETDIIIRNHVNRGDNKSKAELINQYHPLVRMIASTPLPGEQEDVVVATQVRRSDLKLDITPGDYAFAAEIWNFEGARKDETIRAAFVPLTDGDALVGELAFDVLNALRVYAEDWIEAVEQLPNRDLVAIRLASAKTRLPRLFRELQVDKEAENSDRIRIQRESLRRANERRVRVLRESIFKVVEPRRKAYSVMTEGKIAALNRQYEVAAARLDHSETLISRRRGVVSGIVRVHP